MLLATTNPGKIREIVSLLGGLSIELKTLADFPGVPIADETGSTFAENARLKAVHYSRACGLPVIAEDSGFEVDALGGAPGVHSARFLGDEATYPQRFEAIYRAVRAKERDSSTVRFECAVAVVSGSDVLFETTGIVEGRLAPEPAGSDGFGYDPIFFYPPYGRTLAEVSMAEKSAVSHRGKAFAKLREFLISKGARPGGA
jgi:XTP/dITP diphosphohydrolase